MGIFLPDPAHLRAACRRGGVLTCVPFGAMPCAMRTPGKATPDLKAYSEMLHSGAPEPYAYATLLGLERLDLSKLLREVGRGLPFRAYERLARNMALPNDRLLRLVDIARRTLIRRRSEGRFSSDESDRLLVFLGQPCRYSKVTVMRRLRGWKSPNSHSAAPFHSRLPRRKWGLERLRTLHIVSNRACFRSDHLMAHRQGQVCRECVRRRRGAPGWRPMELARVRDCVHVRVCRPGRARTTGSPGAKPESRDLWRSHPGPALRFFRYRAR